MTPTAFWALHPVEFWWLAEAKEEQARQQERGMATSELRDLHDDLVEMGVLKNG